MRTAKTAAVLVAPAAALRAATAAATSRAVAGGFLASICAACSEAGAVSMCTTSHPVVNKNPTHSCTPSSSSCL